MDFDTAIKEAMKDIADAYYANPLAKNDTCPDGFCAHWQERAAAIIRRHLMPLVGVDDAKGGNLRSPQYWVSKLRRELNFLARQAHGIDPLHSPGVTTYECCSQQQCVSARTMFDESEEWRNA